MRAKRPRPADQARPQFRWIVSACPYIGPVTFTPVGMGSSRRGSPEREAELVVSLVASGLVRTRGWRGVSERERPYDRTLQLGLDRLAAVCALAGVPAPRGVSDLVWDWSATRPLNAWPLVFEAAGVLGRCAGRRRVAADRG